MPAGFKYQRVLDQLLAYWNDDPALDSRHSESVQELEKRLVESFSSSEASRWLRRRHEPERHGEWIGERLAELLEADESARRLVEPFYGSELARPAEPWTPAESRESRRPAFGYEDFSLHFGVPRDGAYPVSVLGSPAGEGRSTLRIPFEAELESGLLDKLAVKIQEEGRPPLDTAPASSDFESALDVERIGTLLFRALFAGELRSRLDESLGRVRRSRDRGLRLKLHLDPREPSLSQLAALPWEYLYDDDRQGFLGLSRETPIVRYLEVPQGLDPPPFDPPLRILAVTARPPGLAELDLSVEFRELQEIWASVPGTEVTFLENATLASLRRRLVEERCHVLHFMGHGIFDQGTGEGSLVFDDGRGWAKPVRGRVLVNALRDRDHLRLVVLNTCDSARASYGGGRTPFAIVADSLVMAGLPAVVAMQFPISDEAAISFSSTFYGYLAAGDPVDAATVEGRLAIHFENEESREWGTPVLHMRGRDGLLFKR